MQNTACECWNAVLLSACFLSQLEEQLSRVQREKNDLQSRMEEDQEDMNELMKKHKAAVAQVTPNGAESSGFKHAISSWQAKCFSIASLVSQMQI